ncbi:Uncharacterised protein [Candidatus Bilamarchaeum dharawalense]|uniref:Uncharacterized protein n=1 Tax=Candidatus Bilamarchaeum dharawalense TaxID=2885759 RepID=A0A5E4LS69_9ARCH|nr:Uncharacterised protein [Candidatus Bilamarchaeum dharawalense]
MDIKYLSVLGLVLITLGWFVQYLSISKGKKEIVKMFPALNALGILLLIIDSYIGGALDIVFGNVLTLLGALIVFISIRKK